MTNEEKLLMFRNRLTKTHRHTARLARRQSVTCYRIYDHDLPEFPFCIELYEDKVYLAEYQRHHGMTDEEHAAWLESCIPTICEVLQIPDEKIHFRERRRKAGRLDQYEKLASEKEFFIVKEAGLSFKINLKDYLDTGLFLDHRITRGMVRDEASGKRFLNLFCYTGSFSVYAAAGGAIRIDSVDLSKTYLTWAEENMQLLRTEPPVASPDPSAASETPPTLAALDTAHTSASSDSARAPASSGTESTSASSGPGYRPNSSGSPVAFPDCRFIHADVKQYLDELPADFYDLVVMDPPTFSNSKRMKDFLDIQQDHAELINKTLRAMKPGGILYFSTNYRKFQLENEKIRASSVKDITNATTPFDFQGKLFRWCYRIIK